MAAVRDAGDSASDVGVPSLDGQAAPPDGDLANPDARSIDGSASSGDASSVSEDASATSDAWRQDGSASFPCGAGVCRVDSVCRSFERSDPTCVDGPDACAGARSGVCSDEGPSDGCPGSVWDCVDALCGWGGIEAARRAVLSDGGRSVFCYAL